jgi:hypothetical protein
MGNGYSWDYFAVALATNSAVLAGMAARNHFLGRMEVMGVGVGGVGGEDASFHSCNSSFYDRQPQMRLLAPDSLVA